MLQKFMNKPCTLSGNNGAEVKLSEGVGQFCSCNDTQTTCSNPNWKGHLTGRESCRGDALLCQLFSNSFIQTLTAPLSTITKGPDPWVLTSQHSHQDSQGNHLLGNLSITRCSCQSQGMQSSDSPPGTTHSVATTGTPALGTKLHLSQIPSPAADTLRAGDLGVTVWR